MNKLYVEIELTNRQKRKLVWISQYADKMNLDGKPGMVLGQFHDEIFRVGFIENKKALKIQKIMDKNSVGKKFQEEGRGTHEVSKK